MLNLLKEEIKSNDYSTASDLFSGIGFFSLFISKHFNKVYSYESISENIKMQKKNIKLNGINNIKIIKGDIFKRNIKESEIFVIDPPRGGITKKLIKKVVENHPKKIIYFSCDSATFSRDVFYFSQFGYLLEKVYLVDNFPQTDHFEIFSLLKMQ